MRHALASMDLDLEDDQYYKWYRNQTRNDRDYWDWYENTTALPALDTINDKNVNPVLKDLKRHLMAFYEEAEIHRLYIEHGDLIEAELDLYKEKEVLTALVDVIEFMKLDMTSLDAFTIATNPMGISQSGHASPIDGHYYVTVGPYDNKANIFNVCHEYIHTIVNPILDRLPLDMAQSSRLGTFKNHKYEIFAVALQAMWMPEDEQLSFIQDQAQKRDYDVLESTYKALIRTFAPSNQSLEDFIRAMLYDIYRG